MKVVMIAVATINGKITRSDDPHIYSWTSKEDQDFFQNEIKRAELIIMGSSTYEVIKQQIKHIPGRLRVVLTKNPKKYEKESIPGALEFTSETPRQLIRRLSNYREALVAGGAKIYEAFMKNDLIDEIYLTIEPIVFGKGTPLFVGGIFESKLKLVSMEKLNKDGTVLLRYKVLTK